MRPRAVFDCMVFLQAAAHNTGPAAACWQLVKTGALDLFVSAAASAEVRDVLTRPRTQRQFTQLTPEAVDAYVTEIIGHSTQLVNVPSVFTVERDPKDSLYVNLAVAADANYLVSRDKDLLDLMQDESFRQRFPSLMILDPVSFLRKMAKSVPQAPAPTVEPEAPAD
jgi:putative PIN family toxin of toxin-antitoxin system